MSICRTVARLCLVEAIKGQTLVGDNVRDSLIGGLDLDEAGGVVLDQKKMFIAVYSDASVAGGEGKEACGLHDNGMTMFVIEYGIAAVMFEPASEDSGERVIAGTGLVVTDDNFEFSLDLITRQINDALSDPRNVWGQIFLEMIGEIEKVERSRVGNDSDGVKLAGQQIRITGSMLSDPPKGFDIDPESSLQRFFDLAGASDNDDLKDRAALLESVLIGSGDQLEQIQRRMSMTNRTASLLGLTPLNADAPEAVLETATIDAPTSTVQVSPND